MSAVIGEGVTDSRSREHLAVGPHLAGSGFMNEIFHLPAVFGRHLVGVCYFAYKPVVLPLTKIFIAALRSTSRMALVATEAVAVASREDEDTGQQ